MFTRKTVIEKATNFIGDLKSIGYNPEKVILFGSYINGKPNSLSDVDIAVWDKKFIGVGFIDIEPFAFLISKFPYIEVHTFALDDSSENNPFIWEIENTGISISV